MFFSSLKQSQYESTVLQAQFAERSVAHSEKEELEQKLAAVQNKELQLSEFLKQMANKSNEDKKKMEEKVGFALTFPKWFHPVTVASISQSNQLYLRFQIYP